MYDIRRLLNPALLSTEDVTRLVWWTKGLNAGFGQVEHSREFIPWEFVNEFMDGVTMGNAMYLAKHDIR